MPYRARGNLVEKKTKSGEWVPVKKHPTPEAARAHAAALNKNVRHK